MHPEALDDGTATSALLACAGTIEAYLTGISTGLFEQSSDGDLIAEIHELEALGRRMQVAWHSLIEQAGRRGLPARTGTSTVSALLQNMIQLSPSEAKRRVTAAAELGLRVGTTGEILPPLLPAVAAAQREGAVSAEHARVISQVLERVPVTVGDADLARAERQLVAAARVLRPPDVGKVGARLLAHLDPDGVLALDEEHQRRRRFDLIPLPDGSYRAQGYLTPDCGAQVMAVLSAQSAPAPGSADGAEPVAPDLRTPGQRRHDALADLAGFCLRRNELAAPTTQLLITMTADQAESGSGLAETSFGQLLPVSSALRLADEAAFALLFRDAQGAVLAEGRTRRCASRAQALALIARDRGCSFPGCDKPPEWCQRHHVIPWSRGGPTDVDNLTLLCGHHHRTFDAAGWSCVMRGGLPWWIPPAWLDRERKPRLNHRIRPA